MGPVLKYCLRICLGVVRTAVNPEISLLAPVPGFKLETTENEAGMSRAAIGIYTVAISHVTFTRKCKFPSSRSEFMFDVIMLYLVNWYGTGLVGGTS